MIVVGFACGDDDDSSSPSGSATPSATPESDETRTPRPSRTPKKPATAKATDTPISTFEFDVSTPEIDECELISLGELTAATGEDFSRPGTLDADTCFLDGADGTFVDITTVNLSAYGEGAEQDSFEEYARIFDVEILDSPGDEAYYVDDFGVSVLSGKYELDVSVYRPDGAVDREAAFAVAETAVRNIP
jgi:hypothetical protein